MMHESPRRGFRKIERIKYDFQNDSKRDWGHAKLQQEKPDDFVLATNEYHSVREFVELAFGLKDLKLNGKDEKMTKKK